MLTAQAVNRSESVLLQATGLTKRFGDLTANDGVDITVEAGQIHAILGENGAGKSTLMKMLYGVYAPDDGEVLMDGAKVSLHPPSQARAKGIGMVFQDFRLIPAMTVLDNIALAVSEGGIRLKVRELKQRILEVSSRYKLAVDPDAPVWRLDLGQRQRVEIVKVLMAPHTRVVIFDEPTSVLTPHEVEAFLRMLSELRADGYGILLITHKIGEVMACADRVTVLRAGKVTFSAGREDGLDADRLVATMMDSKPLTAVRKQASSAVSSDSTEPASGVAASIHNATVLGDHGQIVLEGVNLELRAGTITGVAGISGNGQRELAESLYGLRKLQSGYIRIGGLQLTGQPTRRFKEAGVAFVSEDPIKESVVPQFSILEHMPLGGFALEPRGLGADWAAMKHRLEESEEARGLGLADPGRRADRLSGGNVQRMVLTRALLANPSVLVVSYPSRGLDIGTTRSIQQMLVSLAERGTAILLISEDLGELFTLSDELVVLAGRRLLGPYDPERTDPYTIGHYMLEGEGSA